MNASRVVLTYGTFDLFHIGHLNLLKRLKALGDYLVVGVSTDDFNSLKNKRTIVKFEDRIEIVRNIKYVDKAIPENSWEQKVKDIKEHGADIFGIGHDWEGKFDDLKVHCEVVYLPRTPEISSTEIKRSLSLFDKEHVDELKKSIDIISSIVDRFE